MTMTYVQCLEKWHTDYNIKKAIASGELFRIEKGIYSTRFKDIYDICFLTEYVDEYKLKKCFEIYIFQDQGMRESSMSDVQKRISKILFNSHYIKRLSSSRKNWFDMSDEMVLNKITSFLNKLQNQ